MTSGTISDTPPAGCGFDAVRAAVSELITVLRDGGLDHHDDTELLDLLGQSETLRNQWQAVDAEILAVCRDRGIAERECQKSMTKVLERRCLVSPGEAKRRMLAADVVGPRQSPTGLPLPRLREHVGDAMQAGAITAQQVSMVDELLGKLDRAKIHPDTVKKVEAELVQHCRQFGPRELKVLCDRFLAVYDPDGPEPDEKRNQDLRAFRMHPTPSGAVVGDFRLTPRNRGETAGGDVVPGQPAGRHRQRHRHGGPAQPRPTDARRGR